MERRAEGTGEERAGLVSLGLIMQLAGSIVAAYLVALSLEPLLSWFFGESLRLRNYHQYVGRVVPTPAWHLWLLAGAAIIRALLHRRAGTAMLYRHRGALSALWMYLAAAFLHTGLCLALLHLDRSDPIYGLTIVALVGTAWPVCLLAAAARPGFRRALRGGPAATGETAPDEVATLTIFLGLVGAMVALFAVYASIEEPDRYASWTITAIGLLLLVRAFAQLISGLRVAGRVPGESERLATAGYVRVGLIASILAGAALLIHLSGSLVTSAYEYDGYRGRHFAHHFHSSSLARHALIAYLIVLWPVLLRQFVKTRQAMTTTSAVVSRRPDAALGALGWCLLAVGALQLVLVLLGLFAGPNGPSIVWDWASHYDLAAEGGARPAWIQILVIITQIWTALELLGGTTRRRAAATAYAACASLAIILSIQGDMAFLMRTIGAGVQSPASLLTCFQIAFPLVVPIASLVFVQHHLRRETSPPSTAEISS